MFIGFLFVLEFLLWCKGNLNYYLLGFIVAKVESKKDKTPELHWRSSCWSRRASFRRMLLLKIISCSIFEWKFTEVERDEKLLPAVKAENPPKKLSLCVIECEDSLVPRNGACSYHRVSNLNCGGPVNLPPRV